MKSISMNHIFLPILFLFVGLTIPAISYSALESHNLLYQGSFQVPGGVGLDYGGYALAYNPANNSLFITGHTYNQTVAEISIPSVNGTATLLQAPADITEGNLRNIGEGMTDTFGSNGVLMGGLLVQDGQLIGTSFPHYASDAAYTHFTSGLDVDATGDFGGMYRVGETPEVPGARFIDGWMAAIPTSWQTALGGSVISGNGGLSIIASTSYGPAAFSFDHSRLGIDEPVTANALMYYPQSNQTLNGVNDSRAPSRFFNWTTKMAGSVIIPNTDSIVFFGYHGIGDTGYGNGTSDPDAIGTDCLGDGATCFYDPSGMGGKGPHAYPYIYQAWSYDLADLAAVHAGTLDPWEITPASVWELPFEVAPTDLFGGAAAYNPTTEELYVVAPRAGAYGLPLVHVFSVDLTTTASSTFSVGGRAILLNGTVTLQNNSGDSLTLSATDRTTIQNFTFSSELTDAASFNVTVTAQPVGQTCSVMNGVGDILSADMTSVVIVCDGDGGGEVTSTCSDGIQNQDEDGVDCGGSCSACSVGQIYVNSLSELYTAFDGEQDGDEIIIAPGTYTLNSTALSINADNIIIRSSTGNREDVIIQGDGFESNSSIKSIFYFPQGAYGQNTTIKDLTIGRVGWHAIFFNGNGSGNGSTIDNVRIFDCYEQFIKGADVLNVGTDDVTVKNSLFEFTSPPAPNYYTGGIDIHAGDSWLIQDNEFKNIRSPSGAISEHAIHMWSNDPFPGENTIERNKILDCDRGIGIWNNTGSTIIRNNMITSNGLGAFPDVGIDIQNSQNQYVYNNTIWNDPNEGYYAGIEVRGATTTAIVRNNLTNAEIRDINSPTVTESNNIELTTINSWLVSPTTADHHLSMSVSSIIDQGYMGVVTDDFDGQNRSGAIDIGADELELNLVFPPSSLRLN